MTKHIILTDTAIDAADVILVTRGTLPQTLSGLAAGAYTLRDTSAALSGTVVAAASVPGTFAADGWAVATGSGAATVTLSVTTLPADGGAALTALQYSTDGGTTWTALSGTGTGDRTLTMAAASTSYTFALRAVNAVGAGAAAGTKAVTSGAVASWWYARATIDIDYANDRAYVNGTAYASLAAARSAGAIVQSGGIDRIALTPAASWALAAKGTTAAALPVSGAPQYLVALDDGADGTPIDELVMFANALSGSTAYLNFCTYVGSANQYAAIPDASSSKATTVSATVRMALRKKSGASILSINGATLGTSTSTASPTLTQMVVGNRQDGTRGWQGSIGRILFVNEELTEAETNLLLA